MCNNKMNPTPSSIKPLVFLFLAVATIAFFTSHATLSFDPPSRYLEARSLVDHGDLIIRPKPDEVDYPGIYPGKDGRLYSYFGKGQSILFTVPYYICSRWLGIESDKLIRSIISLTIFPLSLGLTALVFFLLLREFAFAPRSCYIAAILLIFTTGIWQLSKEGQEGNHLVFYFTLMAYGLKRYENTGSLKALALSALAVSAAFLTRSDTAPTVLCYLAMAAFLIYQKHKTSNKNKFQTAPFLASLILVIALTLPSLIIYIAINQKLFGNSLTGLEGQDKLFSLSLLPVGLKGLLLSPGRSLFLYNPILLLALPGLILLARHHCRWAIFILLAFTGCLLLHAAYPVFHGNCCWGPRYLVRHFSLLFIPVAFFGLYLAKASFLRRSTFVTIAALSLLVQIAAVSLHHNRELGELMAALPDPWHWTMYEPEANILQHRLVNLYHGIDDMVNDNIAPWPTKPTQQMTIEEKLAAPTLHYLAFWPFHLTYYLPTVKPELKIPLWISTLIFLSGIFIGLIFIFLGKATCPLDFPLCYDPPKKFDKTADQVDPKH